MLVPLVYNIFFATIINVACTRLKPDKDITDTSVHLRKKTGAGRRRELTAGEPDLAMSLWGILYVDDPESPRNHPSSGGR